MIESRQRQHVETIQSAGGMVTAMHPEAARAGAACLAAGGNAVDAFVAAGLAVGVAEPFMSGLGGHGSALVYTPNGVRSIDFVTTAPVSASTSGSVDVTGPRSIPVPATAHGFAILRGSFGRQGADVVAARAVDMASKGVPLEGYGAGMIARFAAMLALDEGARRVFLDADGRPPRPPMSAAMPGDVLAMPAYGATLRQWVVTGDTLWREGPAAAALVRWMERHGGHVRAADLAAAPEPMVGDAARTAFGPYVVNGAPGASGFPFVAQVLGMWNELDSGDIEPGSVAYYHRMIELFRLAFADRFRWLGDPAGGRSPIDSFFDPSSWRRRVHDWSTLRMADVAPAPWGSDQQPHRADTAADGGCTTHVNAIDADGCGVSGTFTLGNPFGAGVVVPETGTLLLNTLYQFDRMSGHPNELRPGMRPVWNGSPIVVTKGSRLVAVLGAPGARRIPTALVQVLLSMLRYDMDAQRAVDFPRVHVENDVVEIDERSGTDVLHGLRSLGHDVRIVQEGPSSANFARPTCIEVLEGGALRCGLDSGRLATAVGVW